MALRLAIDIPDFVRYEFGRAINIKLYEEDGTTLFTGSGYTGVIKAFKRHGDKAYFYRDVARALSVIGEMAQVISDVPITFTSGNHTGSFAWTETARPNIPGYLHLIAVLTKSGAQVMSEPYRVYVFPGESQ